jgi:methylmalonyl-CoA mutase
MATEALLAEFPPVNTEEWEAAIRADLKGADAAKLIWHVEEGLDLKPFYGAEDLSGLTGVGGGPGVFTHARGGRISGDWRIREEVHGSDPEEANLRARDAVLAGAEEIAFCGARIERGSDLAVIFSGLEQIPIHFEGVDSRALRLLRERLSKRPHGNTVSAGFNPLSDVEFAAELITGSDGGLAPFTIHAQQEKGQRTGCAEEVGMALAAGADFLAAMDERGVAVARAAESLAFSFAIGRTFFIEIARLRAFRMLWARVLRSFGVSPEFAAIRIYARTAAGSGISDAPHTDILRGTTEAMAAVLGGADSVSVVPFEECGAGINELGRRLARNTQIILKREMQLSRVADVAGGSYAIEAITEDIAGQAWKVLQDVEAQGGFRSNVATRSLQRIGIED